MSSADKIKEIREARGKLATKQQRRASNPQKSVWVEASAGTGKTKVLSDRVLRLLLSGVRPSKILCLTYTKAAAVEMNQRISARLSKWAVADEKNLLTELNELLGGLPADENDVRQLEARARQQFALLLDTPGGMKIQTIHSFCQEVLKRFPLEAHISPYFEVMDDRRAAEALEEIKSGLLHKIEEEGDMPSAQALNFLTRNVSESKFPEIMNILAENRNKIIRMFNRFGSAEELFGQMSERLGVRPEETEQDIERDFRDNLNQTEIKQIAEALSHGAKSDVQRAETLYRLLQENGGEGWFEVYRGVFLTQKGEAKSATKGAVAADETILEKIRKEAGRILDCENRKTAVRVMASTRAVLLLAGELIAGYNDYKTVHSLMDYEDLIVLTRSLLENPEVAQWVLYKLDGGIDSVLIDEAQDTSPDQWAIVRALTEEFFAGIGAEDKVRTVFVVGDRKQSIYSFQGADPEEFEKMRRYFKAADENFEEVYLDVSFRSTAAVLDSVNTIFGDKEVKPGVVLPGQDIVHLPFRAGEAGRVEIWPLIEPAEDERADAWRPPVERTTGESASQRLAQQIAARIKNMVESGDVLASKGRPVRYRDFMILVQRRNSFVEELVRACKNSGVSIAGVDKIKLSEQIAIQDLISVGRFLLLPTDDLSLAEILKSPLWGLNDDDLFKLCYNRGKASLWTRLGDDKTYAGVYAELQQLLNMADYVRPFELYSFILNTLRGRRKFVERMGEEVEDGIDEFVNMTLDYEQGHVPSLQGFVEWMSKDEAEIKREQDQSEADSVKIMTVHGSKGLQAPIVILPDTVRVAGSKRGNGILWDGMMFYPLCAADYDRVCNEINDKDNRRALEEYRRLLYVALTRAEDRLYICGYKTKNAVKAESWYDICCRNLAKTGHEDEGGNIFFDCGQEIAPKEEKNGGVSGRSVDEDWSWLEEPVVQEGALSRPYTPSRPDEDEADPGLISPVVRGEKHRYRRGTVIHRLLQFIPDAAAENRDEIIKTFLDVNAPDFDEVEKQRIRQEVGRLLKDERFAVLFGPGSRAEVPVMGEAGGKIISGQIDRLAVEGDKVLIVDFKTNRPAARWAEDVPAAYKKQLQAYKQLVEKVYPEKAVRTFILWTDTAVLMPME